jgi:hypothetical protein
MNYLGRIIGIAPLGLFTFLLQLGSEQQWEDWMILALPSISFVVIPSLIAALIGAFSSNRKIFIVVFRTIMPSVGLSCIGTMLLILIVVEDSNRNQTLMWSGFLIASPLLILVCAGVYLFNRRWRYKIRIDQESL